MLRVLVIDENTMAAVAIQRVATKTLARPVKVGTRISPRWLSEPSRGIVFFGAHVDDARRREAMERAKRLQSDVSWMLQRRDDACTLDGKEVADGVRAVVPISSNSLILSRAFLAVERGRLFIGNHSCSFTDLVDPRAFARLDRLTPREFKILRAFSGGLRRAQIAASFSISPNTLDNVVSRIRHKTGLENTDAVRFLSAALSARSSRGRAEDRIGPVGS